MSPVQAWLLAIRPRTLPAATAPVLVGTAQAFRDGRFNLGPAIAALVGALLIQIVSNLANDLFDFKKGADTEARVGPVRVTQAGLISQRGVGIGLVACISLAILVGCYLVWVGGWPVVAIGVVSLICAVAYTGGPFPLGYLGLGELFVFIFFGPVAVAGTYYVESLAFSWIAVLAGVPVGLLCANILVVNNVRDIETDRVAGKRTLAARFGRRFGINLYIANLAGAFLALAAIATLVQTPTPLLLGLFLGIVGVKLTRRLIEGKGGQLNPLLGATAMAELGFSLLFSLEILFRSRF
ncbi:1,4-dihydroxy-2-naphthoate polyprenyltransferase [bacterium]|nr:MAG: 1,4-dihydroxy-2-naphthoate polyprenyltransferase [bacterium]